MIPLNTTVSPSSASTMGWAPASVRSMIFSRRWPSATGPDCQPPEPSGPRRWSWSHMALTAAMSATPPSNLTSPEMPHTCAPPCPGAARRCAGHLVHHPPEVLPTDDHRHTGDTEVAILVAAAPACDRALTVREEAPAAARRADPPHRGG